MVRQLFDYIVLKNIQDREFSGYDVIQMIRREYGVLLSGSQVYHRIERLVRDGYLVKTRVTNKKVYYRVTPKGFSRYQTLRNELRIVI